MMSDWIGARVVDIEMTDGTKYHAETIYSDAVAYEMTAAKHKWPEARAASLNTLAFISWHALRRAGDIDRVITFEAFRDTMRAVRPVYETEDDAAGVGPTLPGQLPG